MGPLSSRQAHLDGNCGHAPMPHPLAAFGCSARPERRALAAHAAEAALRHVELLAAKVEAQAATIADHASRNAALNTALNAALSARVAQLDRRRSVSSVNRCVVTCRLPVYLQGATEHNA